MTFINEDRKISLGVVLLILLISLQAAIAFAAESKDSNGIQIFEVRKKLQMTSNDPIIRDYYVNAGQSLGLKQGASVSVYRKVPLADPFKQETQGHVELPVGMMKVIYSDRTMAIGRIQSVRNSKDSPILDGDVFMVGDRVDLGTISFDKVGEEKGKDEGNAVAEKLPAKEEAVTAESKPTAIEATKTEAKPSNVHTTDSKAKPAPAPQPQDKKTPKEVRASASVPEVEVIAR